jgi:hypothetical protein
MSKYGLMDIVYSEKDKPPHTPSLLVTNGQLNNVSSVQQTLSKTRPVSPQDDRPGIQSTVDHLLSQAEGIDRAPTSTEFTWSQDWNVPLDETGFDFMVDPFFRIHEDWSWANDIGEYATG